MREHVSVIDLAARLEVEPAVIESMASATGLRIAEHDGRRWVRLADAGRIVQALDRPRRREWPATRMRPMRG